MFSEHTCHAKLNLCPLLGISMATVWFLRLETGDTKNISHLVPLDCWLVQDIPKNQSAMP
jgi:hypothetical protein